MEHKEHVVVSMTSFPAAIGYAVKAVESILEGNVLPDKVVLYLTFSQFGEEGLPKGLLDLAASNPRFEVRDYPRDIRSYRKLIPALKDFPESVIVTVDDDVHYDKDMLKSILRWHEEYPEDIIAHRAKRIDLEKPYKKWKKLRWYDFLFGKRYEDFRTLQTGVGGVLYPPHSLKEEMMDEELFTKYSPTADDIWFWAAATANGRRTIPVPFGQNKPRGLGKPKNLSLKTVNFKAGEDRNYKAFHAVMDAYPEIRKRVEE